MKIRHKSGSARGATTPPEHGPRTWIFQANPTKYRILESLRTETKELWNLNQHIREIMPGDRVLIWISGEKAGIYALGTIATAPILTADSPTGQAYWNDKAAGRQIKARVWVRYDRVLLDRPLLKDFIVCDPDLWNLMIVRQPRATNFPVTDAEWRALQEWLEDGRTDDPPGDLP